MNATAGIVVVVALTVGILAMVLPPAPATAGIAAVALGGGALAVRLERRRLHRILHRFDDPDHQRRLSWNELERVVSEQSRELQQLRASAAESEPWPVRLIRSIDGPAMLFSRSEERLVAANGAARDLLGISEAPDRPTLIQTLGSAALVSAVREAGHAPTPVQVDTDLGGRELRATASQVGDQVLVMVTDRTEQRRVEELRRNFVVNASHELKTPATAIQTLTEALEVSLQHATDRTPQLVARLREESARLVRVVHDLLDLRRLEEPGPLERTPVDVAGLVRDVATQLAGQAEERGVTLEVEAPDSAHVAGLAQDLRLVVHNLVANAIQYNRDHGRVEVALRAHDGAYVLTVADTGLGIPRQDLPRIFERFYRVDVARSREQGGTGLGLSIVRNAVERHGGSVQVDSLLGEGSTFTVRLPIGFE